MTMPEPRRHLIALLVALLSLALAAPASARAVVDYGGGSSQLESEVGTVRLMAVGDVMLAQSIGRRIVRNGPLAPWTRVKSYFDQADLVVANLECTISTRGTKWPKTFTFRAPPRAADSLVAAGIDVVSLANNHAMDYGKVAFVDTLDYLDDRGVRRAGGGMNLEEARAPLIGESNGVRIAFPRYVM